MEAGEKRRIPRTEPGKQAFDSFEVDNTSDVAQSVTFVVGEGDYEKIIVSGELNVSAYVTSIGSGESASLPTDVIKTVGLIDTVEEVVAEGQELFRADTTPADSRFAVIQHDGEFYAVHRDNLYRFNKAAGGWSATLGWDLTNIGGSFPGHVFAACVTPGGTIYFISQQNLYVASLLNRVVFLVQSTVIRTPPPTRGGGYLNGKFYFSEKFYDSGLAADVNYLRSYDIETGAIASIPVEVSFGERCWVRGDYVYMASNGNSNYNKLNPVTGDLIEVVSGDAGGLGGKAYSEADDYVFYPQSTEYIYGYADAGTKYGTIYVETTGDSTTRKEIVLKEKFEWFTRGADTIMTGPILKPIYRGVALNEGADYLDKIVSFKWTDGITLKTLSGGTQTLRKRGILDGYSIALSSEVTFSVLVENFG